MVEVVPQVPSSRRAPHMWVVAGANGAGKSTFYRVALQPRGIRWINADDLARSLWPDAAEEHAYAAGEIAAELRASMLAAGLDFATETVFSHESKLALLHNARAMGFRVTLVYVHLNAAELHVARVAQRVAEGGHSVPEHKILARRERVLRLVREALLVADDAVVLDNSDDRDPFRVVARLMRGQASWVADALPAQLRGILP